MFFDPKTVFDWTIAYWAYGPVVHTGTVNTPFAKSGRWFISKWGTCLHGGENMPFDHGMQLVFISEDAMHGKIICDCTMPQSRQRSRCRQAMTLSSASHSGSIDYPDGDSFTKEPADHPSMTTIVTANKGIFGVTR